MKTLLDLVDAIRKLGANYPDATYNNPDCRYDSGEVLRGPHTVCTVASCQGHAVIGCIVGQGAALIGIDAEVLEANGEDGYGEFLEDLYRRELVDTYDAPAGGWDWIGEVQQIQDSGKPWGEAVQRADERHPL